MRLEELDKQLAEVIASIPEIIKDFENRQDEKAYKKLAEFLETVGIFAQIFSEDLGWKYGDTLETTKELNDNFERAISQLTSAQENKFWVAICDVIEYEILPILENWQKIARATLATP